MPKRRPSEHSDTTNAFVTPVSTQKELAKREAQPIGAVASRLIRQSLLVEGSGAAAGSTEESLPEFGFRPFPKRGGIVTNELIDRLREESVD